MADNIVSTYIAYLAISMAVTVWVARTLSRRGRVFLVDAFTGNQELADAVNHLLVVGFYLVNIGFVTLALREGVNPEGWRGAIELLSSKVGVVLVVLGAMHFLNMMVFWKMRRRGLDQMEPPPFPPDAVVGPSALKS